MPGLVLELKQDELILINGAMIRFRTKSRIEINGKARFLFGKQVLGAHDGHTPARRIYLALQTAYVGTEDERRGALEMARSEIKAFRTQTISAMAEELLDKMLLLAEGGEAYDGLKLARILIRHEDSLLRPQSFIVETETPKVESDPRRIIPSP